jgi:hypothetical protein
LPDHAEERFGAQPSLPWPGSPGAARGAWFGQAPILETAGKAWVVHAIQPADAIVVLDAGLETQPFAAAALYKNGWGGLVSTLSPPKRPSSSASPTSQPIQCRQTRALAHP